MSTLNTNDSLNPSPFSFFPYTLIVWSPSGILFNEMVVVFVLANVPVFSSPSSSHVPDTFMSEVMVKSISEKSYVSYITVFSTTFSFSSFT